MAIEALTENIIDGDFTFPVEIEGSPLITTDEVTRSFIITRSYAVLTSTYVPGVQGVPDVVYTDSYLVNDQPSSIQGPILFFQRIFAQLPDDRDETRTVSFTMPGKARAQFSTVTGQVVGWNQYGEASPGTYSVKAAVHISYSTSPDTPTPDITVITYNGAPVDFAGGVYSYVGNHTVVVSPSLTVVEPRWAADGITDPLIIPAEWVLEVNVSRWRGIIWQYEVVRVDTAFL